MVYVQVVRDQGKKPYVGGFRHKITGALSSFCSLSCLCRFFVAHCLLCLMLTGTIFHHASAQTERKIQSKVCGPICSGAVLCGF